MALTVAQRKAAQRARKKAQGMVKVKMPEIWHEPEQAKRLELDIARLIQKSISDSQAICAAIKGENDAK